MFWDCSWVQNNNVNGKNYGTYAFELLQGITIPPSQVPTTHAPTKPQTTCTVTQPTTTGKPTVLQTTKPATQSPVTTTKPPTGELDSDYSLYLQMLPFHRFICFEITLISSSLLCHRVRWCTRCHFVSISLKWKLGTKFVNFVITIFARL